MRACQWWSCAASMVFPMPHNYKWKAKFGGMDVSDAKRLQALEEKNSKLKRLLADALLDNAALKDVGHFPFAFNSTMGPVSGRLVGIDSARVRLGFHGFQGALPKKRLAAWVLRVAER